MVMKRLCGDTLFFFFAFILLPSVLVFSQEHSLGVFEGNCDIGDVLHKGSVTFDSIAMNYKVAGGGDNMWFGTDAFHYVWKKASGNIAISAEISFLGTGGNAHRKAGLIIRQNLDADSPYADAILHGDGLTSMQYREMKGGPTREIQSNIRGPRRIEIQKQGSYVFMSIAPENEQLRSAGGSFKIKFEEPFYIGLGVCSHDNNVLEKAVFSHVDISSDVKSGSGVSSLESTLETISIESQDRKVVYTTTNVIDGPFWSGDGEHIIFSSKGQLFSVPKGGGNPELYNSGILNNPDSGNGFTLDRMTQPGLGDNPESSPDNRYLYFDSDQSGANQIWRMAPDGGSREQITFDEYNNYYPHVSPDGKWIVFLSYDKDVKGHLANQDVMLRLLPTAGGEIQTIAKLFGGQGTIDTNSWAPDSKNLAFVSFRLIYR
jgi:TolB protein